MSVGNTQKLTQERADEMRRLYAIDKIGPKELSERFNCSLPLVWKVIKNQIHTGKPSPRSADAPNIMPPDRIRSIFEAQRRKSGDGYTKQRFADDLGISLRQVQAYMQPEGSEGYRRPGGAVKKVLLDLEWCLNNGMVNRQG